MIAPTTDRCTVCGGNVFAEAVVGSASIERFCLLCGRVPLALQTTASERHLADILAWDRLAMKERLS